VMSVSWSWRKNERRDGLTAGTAGDPGTQGLKDSGFKERDSGKRAIPSRAEAGESVEEGGLAARKGNRGVTVGSSSVSRQATVSAPAAPLGVVLRWLCAGVRVCVSLEGGQQRSE
jgi:hypothetical protein